MALITCLSVYNKPLAIHCRPLRNQAQYTVHIGLHNARQYSVNGAELAENYLEQREVVKVALSTYLYREK